MLSPGYHISFSPQVGGTLLEAQLGRATAAVFVVHEFRMTATVDAKLRANAGALNFFLRLLQSRNGGQDDDLLLHSGDIIGPILIAERRVVGTVRMPCHIPLSIGKIRTDRLG